MIKPDLKHKLFVDHIVLTVINLNDAKIFYSKIFGVPDFEDDSSVMFIAGQTRLFIVPQREEAYAGASFNPNQIGLEHFALGVRTLDELGEIEKILTQEGIRSSGIHIDKHSRKEKIWLDDPSGIRIEFYLRP